MSFFVVAILLFGASLASAQWAPTQCGFNSDQITQWGKTVDPANVLPEYPRPQLVRGAASNWQNLNGLWSFQANAEHRMPLLLNSEPLPSQILVPFPIESCLSGVGQTFKHIQYRTTFKDFQHRDASTTRVLLQFGAVDWQTSVYVNNQAVGNHTGGYDSFTFDVTSFLSTEAGADNDLYVVVYDPSDSGPQPNGKQRISAITNPGGDTYTPSSGIWQTVWLEMVPRTYVSYLQLFPTLGSLTLNVSVRGAAHSDTYKVSAMDGTTVVATKSGQATNAMVQLTIPSPKRWSPASPFLYDLSVELSSGDVVQSYFGLRTITMGKYNNSSPGTGAQVGVDRSGSDMNGYPIQLQSADYNLCWALCNQTKGCDAWAYAIPGCDHYSDPMCWLKNAYPATSDNKCRVSGAEPVPGNTAVRPLLNGEPMFLGGWLDQSFWPDGLYTAPTTDALVFDLQAVLDYGLNGVRLHQKVNPELWYHFADVHGILIMQDMPQKYGHASTALIPYFMADLQAMVYGKFNHPSIIQWETFNEGDCWSVFPNVGDVVAYVKSIDITRLVDADSGGGANGKGYGDVNDIHDYPAPRDPKPSLTQYAMIGEYGGLGYFVADKEWVKKGCYAYKTVSSAQSFADTYVQYTQSILGNAGDISCVIYTQTTDIEEECDGYLNYDRTAKFTAAQASQVKSANEKMINGMWAKAKGQ